METVLNKKREEEGWGLRSPCICNHCIRIQIWKRTQNRTNVLSIIILFFFEFWPTKITFKFFCLTGYCFHWTINILVWHSNEYTQKRQFYILVETIFFTLLLFFLQTERVWRTTSYIARKGSCLLTKRWMKNHYMIWKQTTELIDGQCNKCFCSFRVPTQQ